MILFSQARVYDIHFYYILIKQNINMNLIINI